ncbi:unnamed protein product [Acanthosepion pharaonis]|uniref:Uncharacterized protein n=1 Tax=Acanthosepion pharaonis TaxID=158019 RepID=A0A812ELW9_ACAPH|nr:unnamed protein product [Sepia pharaonis]
MFCNVPSRIDFIKLLTSSKTLFQRSPLLLILKALSLYLPCTLPLCFSFLYLSTFSLFYHILSPFFSLSLLPSFLSFLFISLFLISFFFVISFFLYSFFSFSIFTSPFLFLSLSLPFLSFFVFSLFLFLYSHHFCLVFFSHLSLSLSLSLYSSLLTFSKCIEIPKVRRKPSFCRSRTRVVSAVVVGPPHVVPIFRRPPVLPDARNAPLELVRRIVNAQLRPRPSRTRRAPRQWSSDHYLKS